MNNFENICEAILTKGLVRALANQGKARARCECGFVIPVYPGKYPTACPNCGSEFEKKMDGGKLVDVPADEIDASPANPTKSEPEGVRDMKIDGNRVSGAIVPAQAFNANSKAHVDDPTKPVSTPGEGPTLDDEEDEQED